MQLQFGTRCERPSVSQLLCYGRVFPPTLMVHVALTCFSHRNAMLVYFVGLIIPDIMDSYWGSF